MPEADDYRVGPIDFMLQQYFPFRYNHHIEPLAEVVRAQLVVPKRSVFIQHIANRVSKHFCTVSLVSGIPTVHIIHRAY